MQARGGVRGSAGWGGFGEGAMVEMLLLLFANRVCMSDICNNLQAYYDF